MQEIIKILISVGVLVLGFFIGMYMRSQTKDEQKDGKKYFRIITIVSFILVIIGLTTGKDWLLFTFAFTAIVTAQSLRK
ncbi:MAG: hypothetical protein PF542_03465 [Nanoarchaeota archaeon]|jgi:uncharacterized membrane protein|nr:hypothetical protein [Nanoarchaeota archaeon]